MGTRTSRPCTGSSAPCFPMAELNGPQQAAVDYVHGPLLVLAGAGSGKTRVITRKIAHLIGRGLYDARHLAAITFTNKAAQEMRARVGKLLKGRDAEGLWISTFHSLGLHLLRREQGAVGLKPGFSLFDAEDSANLLKELASKEPAGSRMAPAALAWRISQWKNALLEPAAVASQAEDPFEVQVVRLYGAYERSLRAYNALDFDDLIGLPVRLLRDHPDIRERWQGRIRYLLVDEYQDTNGAQYELVRLLVAPLGRFTAVGDDDQSIYAWRGARPENLNLLQQDFPALKVIKLEQNYRSTERILRSANQLISHNPRVMDKRLWSQLGAGEPIRVIRCSDEAQEARRVVSEILHRRFTQNSNAGDYAILYRGNHQAREFEKALKEQAIPYSLSGGGSFFARSEIRDLMAYLRLLTNPADDAALLRIVNVPRREIGPATLEKLAAHAQTQELSLLAACGDAGLAATLDQRACTRLRVFARLIDRYRLRAEREAPAALLEDLLADLDYRAWLRELSSDERAAARRREAVQDLLEWIKVLHRDRGVDFGELVNRLSLMDLLDRREEDQGDRVRLMTLHAAKGLEFPHVFLVGMEEELLPHRASIEEDSIEEERRLAYVGITRARQSLTLTLTARRRRNGEFQASIPSRFLQELPAQDLVWVGEESAAARQEQRGRAAQHLAGLKGLLAD